MPVKKVAVGSRIRHDGLYRLTNGRSHLYWRPSQARPIEAEVPMHQAFLPMMIDPA
jgi:hypothetical protein